MPKKKARFKLADKDVFFDYVETDKSPHCVDCRYANIKEVDPPCVDCNGSKFDDNMTGRSYFKEREGLIYD